MRAVSSLAVSVLVLASGCARSAPVSETTPSTPAPAATVGDAGEPETSAPLVLAPADAAAAVVDAAADASVEASVLDAGAREVDGMLLVPAGPFTMGQDRGGEDDEHPAHEVTLDAFWLDRTEVTNEAYFECVRAKQCPSPDRGASRASKAGPDEIFRRPQQPVMGVGWFDANAYCRFRGKRLPREAEWEKAARDTDARRFPWGNEPPTPERACFGRALGGGTTDDVGTHPAGRGPYGHDDLGGNVWEWMADEYDPYAYKRPGAARGEPGTCKEILKAQDELREQGKQGYTGSNPIPTTCEHVLRGGAFNYDGPGLRAMNRVHHPGTFHLVMAGFRCAKDAK